MAQKQILQEFKINKQMSDEEQSHKIDVLTSKAETVKTNNHFKMWEPLAYLLKVYGELRQMLY